ncbi:MAG: efflux RND transporter periplasmic adaptor subunit [Alicyclobacillus sp.]|nr:efflux RND transporter periplasmic adaptor subunit [Alicyclobacillus sp.]
MKERKTRRSVWLVAAAVLVVAALVAWWWSRPKAPLVQLATVQRQTLNNEVFASGNVVPNERQIVMPAALASPTATFHVEVGDRVRIGDVLITTPNQAQAAAVAAAREAVSSARAALEQAEQQYQTAPPGFQPQLQGALANAQSAYAQAQAQLAQAQAAYEATVIRARIAGTVLLENRDGIAPDGSAAPLLEVVGFGKQIVVDVSQVDAVHIHPGLRAQVTTEAYPNQTWTVTVSRVAPFATTAAAGAGQVEVDLAAKPGFPVPYGYQVDVHIVSSTHRQTPVVPYDALSQDGANYVVYVYRAGRVYKRTVELGITGDTVVEVERGLRPGDQVVLNPPPGLADGERVRVR